MAARVAATAMTGARRATAPAALGTVAGLASTRLVERAVYGMFRPVFGNSGDGLTGPQRTARLLFTASAAVMTAGLLMSDSRPAVRGAAVGATAGFTWHALNEIGINV